MRSKPAPGERPLFWVGSSKRGLLAMPGPVIREIGIALGVIEIVSSFDGDAFRAIYTVKFRQAIYVLHCFQKKSPSGIKTAKVDVDLVTKRLKAARSDYEARYGKTSN